MKKLVTGVLTLTLCMTMALPVFAADPTDIGPGTTPPTGDTKVSFNVAPTYSITIPPTVGLTKKETGGTVTYESNGTISAAAGLRLKKDEQIKVTLTTCNYELRSDEGATLAYTVNADGTEITTSNNTIATFTTNTEAQTSTLHFAANDPTYAGEYSDTVTFTVAVESLTID